MSTATAEFTSAQKCNAAGKALKLLRSLPTDKETTETKDGWTFTGLEWSDKDTQAKTYNVVQWQCFPK